LDKVQVPGVRWGTLDTSDFENLLLTPISILHPSSLAGAPVDNQASDQILHSVVKIQVVNVTTTGAVNITDPMWHRLIMVKNTTPCCGV